MNYLLKNKRRGQRSILSVSLIVILFVLILVFFSSRITALGGIFSTIGRPFWAIKSDISNSFETIATFFTSKNTLQAENDTLKAELAGNAAAQTNADLVAQQNAYLKSVFGRTDIQNLVVAGVLQGPGSTLYDTFVLDAGANDNVHQGDVVLVDGITPVGYIAEVYAHTSLAKLYSSPGEQTPVVVSGANVSVSATGQGDGNFELQVPQGVSVPIGTAIVLPGLSAQVVGTVMTIDVDIAHSTQTIYFRSPFNTNQLQTVFIQGQ